MPIATSDKIIALLAALSADDIEALPPVQRRRLADGCKRRCAGRPAEGSPAQGRRAPPAGRRLSAARMMTTPWIVCGWYTPDYRPWVEKLVASLDAVGAPHDIIEAPKLAGLWEANTLARPAQVLAAMDRHPGKVVIFLDVNCVVRGDLAPLADLRGDVAFRFRTRRKRGRGGFRAGFLSGTFVVKPTVHGRRFVEAWRGIATRWGDTDQTTLGLVLGAVDGVSIEPLHEKWIYDGVIAHDHASCATRKISVTAVRLNRLRNLLGWQGP